jgi:Na+/proline symporter
VTPTLLALFAYLVLQFGIGIWVSRRIRSEADYLLAGRKLGYPLAVFSIFATWFGAESIVGSAGNAYRDGVSLANAEPFGYGLCLILMGAIFAVPLWRRGLTTLADLFRDRFSPGVERWAAVVMIPSSIFWAAAQIRGFGHVLATASTLDVDGAIVLAAAIVVLYTVFGGLLADAMTDLVQGILLVGGLIALFVGVARAHGGAWKIVGDVFTDERVTFWATGGSFWELVEEWSIPICGSVVATELVSRVIATRAPEVGRRSAFAAGALYLALGLVPLALGVAGARLLPGLEDAEQIVPALAQDHLPTIFFALFAGALVSAVLSTVDSTLLVSAGLLSHNLVGPWLGVTDEGRKVRLARGAVAAFGVVAFLLALRAEGVYELVEQASAFGSSGVLVLVVFGLFTRWGGAWAGLSTLAAGLGVYLAGVLLDWPYPYLASLAASVLLFLAVAALEHPFPAASG